MRWPPPARRVKPTSWLGATLLCCLREHEWLLSAEHPVAVLVVGVRGQDGEATATNASTKNSGQSSRWPVTPRFRPEAARCRSFFRSKLGFRNGLMPSKRVCACAFHGLAKLSSPGADPSRQEFAPLPQVQLGSLSSRDMGSDMDLIGDSGRSEEARGAAGNRSRRGLRTQKCGDIGPTA